MEQLKQLINQNFERILVGIILIATFLGTYFIEEKSIVLNFYYLPVLSAGYFLGRRTGVLTAILSILVVIISVLLFPNSFFKEQESLASLPYYFPGVDFSSWQALQ